MRLAVSFFSGNVRLAVSFFSGNVRLVVSFFSGNKRLAVSFFSGNVRLAVSFFIRRCVGISIFCKAKGLEVPIRLFVLMTRSRHLMLNFIKATFNFREEVNPNFS